MIYKQQLLYVAVTGHESGGRMWRVAINRMLICLVFQQGKAITKIKLFGLVTIDALNVSQQLFSP